MANNIINMFPLRKGFDTSEATVTADKLWNGETAFGPNGKITGTLSAAQAYFIDGTMPSSELGQDGDIAYMVYTEG